MGPSVLAGYVFSQPSSRRLAVPGHQGPERAVLHEQADTIEVLVPPGHPGGWGQDGHLHAAEVDHPVTGQQALGARGLDRRRQLAEGLGCRRDAVVEEELRLEALNGRNQARDVVRVAVGGCHDRETPTPY